MNQAPRGWNNWLLVAGVLAIALLPLIIVRQGEFAGADSKAETAIQEIQPAYEPWFNPIIEPASSEIASLLFASQAALGAGVIGYVIGLYRGRTIAQKQGTEPRE